MAWMWFLFASINFFRSNHRYGWHLYATQLKYMQRKPFLSLKYSIIEFSYVLYNTLER